MTNPSRPVTKLVTKLVLVSVAAIFTALTTACSKPSQAQDLFNIDAQLPPGLPYAVLNWTALTTGVDRQAGTMYTVYGNDIAVAVARSAARVPYPAGSVVAVVTWAQRDDPHWFGARIPGHPLSAELVEIRPGSNGTATTPIYARYTGSPFHKELVHDEPERIASILGEQSPSLP